MRKTRGGWGETIAPFPKSCPSYFRFAPFNTFPLNYLRAWHRLGSLRRQYFRSSLLSTRKVTWRYFSGGEKRRRLEIRLRPQVACSRLSDSGEDTKVKGTRKVGGAKKRKRKEEIPTANIVSTTRRTTLCWVRGNIKELLFIKLTLYLSLSFGNIRTGSLPLGNKDEECSWKMDG